MKDLFFENNFHSRRLSHSSFDWKHWKNTLKRSILEDDNSISWKTIDFIIVRIIIRKLVQSELLDTFMMRNDWRYNGRDGRAKIEK